MAPARHSETALLVAFTWNEMPQTVSSPLCLATVYFPGNVSLVLLQNVNRVQQTTWTHLVENSLIQKKATSLRNVSFINNMLPIDCKTLYSPLYERRVGSVPVDTVPRTAPQRIWNVVSRRRTPKVGVSLAALVEVTRPLESGMIFSRPWNHRKEHK